MSIHSINKKILSKNELFLFYDATTGTNIVNAFITIVYYFLIAVPLDFMGPYLDPLTFAFLVFIKFLFLCIILMSLLYLPLRRGLVITSSEIILIRFYFDRIVSRKKFNKSAFTVTLVPRNTTNNENPNWIALVSDKKKIFLLNNTMAFENIILLLKEYGLHLDSKLVHTYEVHSY